MLCGDPGVPIHGPSGASVHLRGVARGLTALGHQVAVAALRDEDERGRHDVPLGVPSVVSRPRTWPRGLRTLGEQRDGRRLARRAVEAFGEPDLIWERYSLLCDGGVRLARKLGVPHLLEVNAPLSLERRPHPLERWLLQNTDRVIAVSEWIAKWARIQGAREVICVPNGSDLVPGDRERTRAELGLTGLVLVHHGSLRAWHGLGFLPQLLEPLDATLLLIGDGDGEREGRIVRHGAVGPRRLGDLLAAGDVLVAPYPPSAPPWFDPLKLHDARAVGLPAVGSSHRACRSADRRVGLWEVQAWVAAIREVAGQRTVPVSRPWRKVCEEVLAAP